MFVDEAVIKITAGNGGNGAATFRREKYIPKGGPDGGDGGDGGSVYIVCKSNLDTLDYFSSHKIFKAQNGENGMKKKMYGKGGQDLLIEVPPGTLVFELINGKYELKKDLINSGDDFLIAKGGKGGLGNVHFKSSTNQTPREFTYGEKGECKDIKLEMKMIAHIGLVGLPNAGKSTLTNALTNTNAKTGDYPFTTQIPQLGALNYFKNIIIADIPGIIEEASAGKGLGLKFLRHISRTKVLIYLLDGTRKPLEEYNILKSELESYDPKLNKKDSLIVINKIDLISKDQISSIVKDFSHSDIILISAKQKINISLLQNKISKLLTLDN